MTERNITDLICFLKTLTDDYKPEKTPTSPECAN
jgi:hypothetical protein